MPKEVMRRQASDNEYLHKDFHGALSVGLDYLEKNFGEESVTEFLYQFARSFYAPLTDTTRDRGLAALEAHFRQIYSAEGAAFEITASEDELTLRVEACPAVAHMRANNYPVARLWRETDETVDRAIVEGTEFDAETLEYDETTGRSVRRFFRRNRS